MLMNFQDDSQDKKSSASTVATNSILVICDLQKKHSYSCF